VERLTVRSRIAIVITLLIGLVAVLAPASSAANAAVTWYQDDSAKTITVTVRIALYVDPPPSNTTQQTRVLDAVQRISKAINAIWNGKSFKCYELKVIVLIRLASGPGDVQANEHAVRINTSAVPRSRPRGMENHRSFVSSADYDSDDYLSDDHQWDPRTGPTDQPSEWALTESPGAYAHEFGHILGLDDNYVEGTGQLREGAAKDLMFHHNMPLSDQSVVKAVRRSGEIDESRIKCPLNIRLPKSTLGIPGFLSLSLEVEGCAPDYDPSSTDPSRPGKVVFFGESFFSGAYLDAYPQIPFRVTERGGAVSFLSTWRYPASYVAVSLGAGGEIQQEVKVKRVPLVNQPSLATLNNSGGTAALENIMEITPRDTPCP
jgi:hypothetical protein